MGAMLSDEKVRPWLSLAAIVGFDSEEDDGGTGGEEGTESDGEEGGEPTAEELQEAGRKALAAERVGRKAAEKKVLALQKKLDELSGAADGDEGEENDEEDGRKKPPVKKAAGRQSQAERDALAKVDKLSAGFRQSALRDTLAKVASNFNDPMDALAHIDLSLIDVTQDEDDPSIVVWDESELKAVIKDLAKRKPYLLKIGDGAGGQGKGPRQPGTPKFGGTGVKSPADDQLADFKRRFPAVRDAVG